MAVATILANLAYYTFVVGGDIFEYRVYSHAVPMLLLALLWLLNAAEVGRWRSLATLAIVVVAAAPIAWLHFSLSSRVEPEVAALEDVGAEVAPHLPPALRWYGAWLDREQAWLGARLLCGRYHNHKCFTELLERTYPTREVGEAVHLEGNPIHAAKAVGVAGWSLPTIAILDLYGLNDHVVARAPVRRDALRQMAHDRVAPPAYVASLRPNVTIVHSEPRLRIKPRNRRELTDQRIIALENRWWNQGAR